MGKRKIDPVTGKCIKFASDTNRKKRPTKKLRTPEEKGAQRLGGGCTKSVKSQKVHHIVSLACI